MKIIFFNINDGRIDKEGLVKYINDNKKNTNIFCFQEAFDGVKILIRDLLPDFKSIYSYKWVSKPDHFGQSIYIDKGYEFIRSEEIFQNKPNLGIAIYTELSCADKHLHLINCHGLSRPVDKLDCPERLDQSSEIIKFCKNLIGPVIIGGDFNYSNKTESVSMFTNAGFRNLIEDFDVNSTRNEVVWKKYPQSKQYFSDYIFVNNDVKVVNFSVPYTEVSDHLPLELIIKFWPIK